MSGRFAVPLRIAAVSATTAVLGAMAAFPAAAADNGNVKVVNTETVQVYTDATGAIDTKRVYEQLAMTGKGSVTLHNPIETDGLRNLDGFGGFEVKDGQQVANLTVDGEQRLRSVSDYSGKLPLDVHVRYFLDGKPVEPGDVVGKDGKLEVKYTVKNVTGVEQDVTFDDGKGGTVTKTVEVPIPMVGSLTTVAPPTFTDVTSSEANMAGDGKGGTKMSFTMTLFPPIGSDTAEFGYTANITDGVIPRASISALPVNPLESPSFKAAGTSYKGGADTGVELTDGATQIDENLLKLRDGAGELLAGLIQLRDGAVKLDAGLGGVAAPGAKRLADGANQLNSGIGQIDDGAGKLSAGADRLSAGAADLSAGLNKAGRKAPALVAGLSELRGGLVRVDNGLKTLSSGVAAVRKNEKYQALLRGLDDMLAGVGSTGDAGSLTWGVNEVREGLESTAVPGIQEMKAGVHGAPSEPGAYEKLGCALVILKDVRDGTIPGRYPGTDPCYYSAANPTMAVPPMVKLASPTTADKTQWTPENFKWATVDSLITSLATGRSDLFDPTNPYNKDTLYGGLNLLYAGLTNVDPSQKPGALLALSNIECGLDSTSLSKDDSSLSLGCADLRPGKPGLRQGLGQVAEGVPTLVNTIIDAVQAGIGSAADVPADKTLRGGMSGLITGTDLISSGGGDLIAGLGLLADGGGQLSAGSKELANGAGQLADGTGKASDGSSQLAAGANKLSTGLGEAADGSGKLADGLGKAADGAPALRDGAQRLSDEGTSKLVEAGKSTAQNYGEMYATIEAGAKRAQTDDMVYGAPENAVGLAAYSYEIKGEDGEGSRNMTRGLGGLAVLGAGAAVFGLRRRIV